jgi:hypothetical protein
LQMDKARAGTIFARTIYKAYAQQCAEGKTVTTGARRHHAASAVSMSGPHDV